MGPGRSDPRGELVRPYAVTRGRTEPQQDIALEAVLVTTQVGRQESRFSGHDKQRIAGLCDNRALSLAEIAAYTRLPLGVTRVLVADMVADGLLALHDTAIVQGYEDRMELLERVLSGLRRL
ncbi:MAG TPA: DUF742 domain-containing protein [Micromonosporaceae bacterium]|jgi:hypothetical protein|nr:DUF742 domain-containing protein [Micromonosporaceae bacterium]